MFDEMQEKKPGDGEQTRNCNSGSTQATILVVDDDEAVRNVLREFLSFHGYGVITAGMPEEA
jgi:CheY-like chemotaxis protein